jgi:hypothetical protein
MSNDDALMIFIDALMTSTAQGQSFENLIILRTSTVKRR